MLKVGVTGGIGSGKTLVCEVLKKLGVPVFNADNVAKDCLNTNRDIINSITEYFGEEIYENNGLNKKKLAGIVFKNKNALQKINLIVHPVVRQKFIDWCKLHEDKPYVVEEAAILFESGAYKELDYTINITAPEQIRIERVMKRDGSTYEEVRNRMSNQFSDEQRMQLADFNIINDNEKMILQQILEIHNKIINK
ncbi:MAG: dephospho-CoA kinase [Bacteroidetes bacterium GWC2_33_15]|nr:MAG: dephospho-CoA kinase [Bacteroidetes bacterium GWA2_33_15]OFX51116.1 MAG: dephospho-CoA kinase [Bacteroidetes bacterium GWC2_33_15]OFX66451.1 MAG: dephospho-CoA kinase [Bacteroidetes bacterium GWB2_32_14]OFX70324.1 MAG: dephospho-CoA kinase [Bacteroidetes bacterium GWD2_33_33]HAN17326.1 dephospho-CoA kinase [Bacteroidales bacterium]